MGFCPLVHDVESQDVASFELVELVFGQPAVEGQSPTNQSSYRRQHNADILQGRRGVWRAGIAGSEALEKATNGGQGMVASKGLSRHLLRRSL
jgi:hypothetical protein